MTELVGRLLTEIKAKRIHILIAGDVMVDRWVHGALAECQDGCPKFMQEEVVETPGGAANAQRCLSNWNVSTSLYGQTNNERAVKTRHVEDGKIVFRADNDGPRPRGIGLQWARDLALEMAKCVSGVLLSDYDKGFLTPDFIREVAGVCRQRGIPCVADCKRAPEMYQGCVLKANGAWGVRHLANDNQSLRCSLKGVWGSQYVETHGADYPAVWDGSDWANTPIPDLPLVACRNHVGAGDCFAAHLVLALACGFTLRDAAALAHSAGRVYVQSPHNRPPMPAEVAADLEQARRGEPCSQAVSNSS